MSRCFTSLFILLSLMTVASCSGHHGGSVFFLKGPSEMDENTSASYVVSVVGEEPDSYDWMVDPPSAGNFDKPHSSEVKFHASPRTSEGDKKATIGVAIAFGGGVAYKSIELTIKYIVANHPYGPGKDAPVAAAHADFTTVEPGGTVHFFDDSTDPNGKADIVQWGWDFSYDPNDGFVSESKDQNPVHVFEDEGTYAVQLSVTDSTGISDLLDKPIEISVTTGNIAPVAQAHAESTVVDEGAFVQFFDDSIDANGQSDIVKWEWDFSYVESEGFNAESLEQNPTVQFPALGTFEVQLRVTDASGLTDMLDTPIEIQVLPPDNPPVAAAHALSTVINDGDSIQFIDDSTDPDGQADIVKWEWDFSYVPTEGFHAERTDENPSVQFPNVGIYEVQLRVTDTYGLSDMLDEPIEISVYTPGWAVQWGFKNADTEFETVAVDHDGNAYVAGSFTRTVDFDPGPGEKYLSAPPEGAGYISKFDPNGNFLWVNQLDVGTIRLCTGDFDGIFYCNNTESGSGPQSSADIVHLSSSGDVISQFRLSGSYVGDDYSYSTVQYTIYGMAVDASLNIYIVQEYFAGDFIHVWYSDPPWDNWVETDSLTEDKFVKYTATGDVTRELQYESVPYRSIVYRNDGSLVGLSEDSIVLIDSDGNQVNYVHFPIGIDIKSVSCDQDGDIFYLGATDPGMDVDPGPGFYTVSDYYGVFACKLDPNMQFVWGRDWPSTMLAGHWDDGYWYPMITSDNSENVYLTGLFKSGLDFDPGPGVSFHAPYLWSFPDTFIIALDSSGNYRWGAQYSSPIKNTYAVRYAEVAADSKGHAYIAGCFKYFLDFDPGPGLDVRPSHNPSDYLLDTFLAKVGPTDVE